ncbi:metallophosphoesterase [Mycolicibacterium conceptionense]|uniref:Metallophosphoesterase n=1 Tax=Mycolicibacterium conceptionense TaxID=451644 RepID=A0A0U1DVW6_9MYCO|nr:metallophosphoesterase [Mycolicibacterium conceptionense]
MLLVGGTTAILGAGAGAAVDDAIRSSGPELWQRADRSDAPRVSGLHLQYGADASSEVVVSWHTAARVSNPRVRYGTPNDGFGETVAADTVTYRDGQSGTEVRVHHARLTGLLPDTDYIYGAVHDGTSPELGTARTAPRGRAALRFTSFGDQSTPTLDAMVANAFGSDNRGSPAAGDITTAVENARPLFNVVNGDLCYANLSGDRIRTWSDWFENNSRSARHRPWMPLRATTRTSWATAPSDMAPIRRTSHCPIPARTPSCAACGTRSPRVRYG